MEKDNKPFLWSDHIFWEHGSSVLDCGSKGHEFEAHQRHYCVL